jgi:hypothetical protein
MKFGPKETKELNQYLRTGRNRNRQFLTTQLVDDLEPGSLKDELLKDFDPSQETYEEYLQRKSLERPFNMADGGRIEFKDRGYVKMTPEEKAAAYAKRTNAAKIAKETNFKNLIDKIFDTEDFANFKSKPTDAQLRFAERAGKVREGTGIIPAQYIKEFNQAIKAGVDSPEFKNILRITGRSTEDILKLNELRPGGAVPIKVRAEAAEKSFPEDRKKTELEKKESAKKVKVKRAGLEKTAKDFASEADLKDFNLINQGKKNINKFFKNNPDAINDTAFGRNIKNMMSIRIGKDGNFYSRLMPDDYYLKKAKEGKLFDIFDMKAVKSGSKFVRVPYNINITPGQFNSAFIEGQVNKLFTKGVNADAVKNLNNFLVDKNIRVELPNVGYMGAKPDVAATVGTKEGTRTFPRIVETLKKMEAPSNILRNFIDIAPLPGPLKVLKKFADGGLSGGDKSGPPPESGPNSQGLPGLLKRVRNL